MKSQLNNNDLFETGYADDLFYGYFDAEIHFIQITLERHLDFLYQLSIKQHGASHFTRRNNRFYDFRLRIPGKYLVLINSC